MFVYRSFIKQSKTIWRCNPI